ncbi:MAG: rhomboid family intramembrane serine protease [Candidatus Krumholzibacteriota bacterium]|nr:rhomboid family intramembrane serine protease [Candidatus Krumholzibacteriota bacterium]
MIIPIGTKAALALKPKVTISLIAICFLVHLFSSLLGGQAEEDLFRVHKRLYASQVRLYLIEKSSSSNSSVYLGKTAEEGIRIIEEADNYADIQYGIMHATGLTCTAIEKIEDFGKVLKKREDGHYAEGSDGQYEFENWKRLKGKEDDVLNAHVNFALGLVPSKMNRVHTFFTHLFLHGDIWHLLGNMLFLWVVGCLLEDSWGRWPFLGFYLLGGVFAGLAHCLQDSSSSIPLIGASGAIAAAMGAFTVRHFMTKIKFFYFFILLFRPFWGTFHLPAFVFLPFWFIQQVALKSLSDFVGGSNVAYLAHIAGYMGGVITALTVKATGLESKWINPMVHRKQINEGVRRDPRFDAACEQLQNGGVERARVVFAQLLKESPGDLALIQDIAILYREHGLIEESAKLFDPSLKNLLLKSRYQEAAHLALDLINQPAVMDVNPQLLLRVGKWLSEQNHFGETHDIYRYIIINSASPQVSAKTSLALAKLLSEKMNNGQDALSVLERAKGLDLDASWRERIVELEYAISNAGRGAFQA